MDAPTNRQELKMFFCAQQDLNTAIAKSAPLEEIAECLDEIDVIRLLTNMSGVKRRCQVLLAAHAHIAPFTAYRIL